jgi:hypothetical protein
VLRLGEDDSCEFFLSHLDQRALSRAKDCSWVSILAFWAIMAIPAESQPIQSSKAGGTWLGESALEAREF